MQTKQFTIGQILSITTGIMLVRDFGDVYLILDYMEGYGHQTLELSEAAQRCIPFLKQQFPQFDEIVIPGKGALKTPEDWFEWVDTLGDQYGFYHEVQALPTEGRGESERDAVTRIWTKLKGSADNLIEIDMNDFTAEDNDENGFDELGTLPPKETRK